MPTSIRFPLTTPFQTHRALPAAVTLTMSPAPQPPRTFAVLERLQLDF